MFENFEIAVTSFCSVSGMMYPLILKSNVLLIIRSSLLVSSVWKPKESIIVLNWYLSGLPQYASEAYSIASTILFSCST